MLLDDESSIETVGAPSYRTIDIRSETDEEIFA